MSWFDRARTVFKSDADQVKENRIVREFVPSVLEKVEIVPSQYKMVSGIVIKQQPTRGVTVSLYHVFCSGCDFHSEACGDETIEMLKQVYWIHECK